MHNESILGACGDRYQGQREQKMDYFSITPYICYWNIPDTLVKKDL